MPRPLLVLITATMLLAGAAAAAPVDFTKEIAPIFSQRCVRCHNAEEKKGKWSLATATDFFKKRGGHEDVVIRGDPDNSLLVDLISPLSKHQAEMPKEGDPLTLDEVALVRRWIADGAPWPEGFLIEPRKRGDKNWWSLQPLRPPQEAEGSAIDRLLLAKLKENGLAMDPPAEPRDLIRRATFDLTGLPPSPEEVDAFVKACAAGADEAYTALLDRLLASPRYGEQWGRHWLDVVRFGESTGFERNIIHDDAWPFRDYVIRSLNDDKPFDRFILEHLAGDQLAPGDPAIEVGTGFLVAGPYDNVGNQDVKAQAQIRANTLDDVITATGSAFLGLTVHCARCHDHKFDPIPQADYYRLQAAFAGVRQGSRPLATRAERDAVAAQREPAKAGLARLERELGPLEQRATEQVRARRDELMAGFTRPAISGDANEELLAEQVEAQFVRMTFPLTRPGGRQDVVLQECEVWSAGPAPRNVALEATITARGTRPSQENAYRPELLIDGRFDQPWVASGASMEPQFTIRLAHPEKIARLVWTQQKNRKEKTKLADEYLFEVSLDGQHWQHVSDQHDRQPLSPARLEEELRQAALTPEDRAQRAQLLAQRLAAEKKLAQVAALPTAWIGTFEKPAAATYLMKGGDPQKRGDDIAPGSLAMLEVAPKFTLPLNAPEAERRLALARWIVAPENPLTPRVLANRVWHWHFGTGIVDTPSDFGYMGGRPTHPALLDYLASRLQANGWQLKPLHREIMLSQAYRQSSAWRKDGADRDHDARWLWRFPPHRLSAEELRDTMLAVAGKLDLNKSSGPGFRLYQYLNDNVSTYVPLDRVGPETYRRAVFHQNARASTVDLLTDFDAPDCAFSTPRRSSTTTPLQALTLFNHAFTVDMSNALAERLRTEAGTEIAAQVRRGMALAYGREPAHVEQAAAERVVAAHGLAAFCRALLNSNELLYLP